MDTRNLKIKMSASLEVSQEFLFASSNFWWPQAFLVMWLHELDLSPSSPGLLQVSLSVYSDKDTYHWIQSDPGWCLHNGLILISLITSTKTLCQVRAHLHVPRVKCIFRGPIFNPYTWVYHHLLQVYCTFSCPFHFPYQVNTHTHIHSHIPSYWDFDLVCFKSRNLEI